MYPAFLSVYSRPSTLFSSSSPYLTSTTFIPTFSLSTAIQVNRLLPIKRASILNPYANTQTQITCFDNSHLNYEEEEESLVTLTDPATKRTLNVGIEHTIVHAGDTYLVCYPVDDPVSFAYTSDQDSVLEPVDDPAKIQSLFPNAEAVLAEEHIELKNSAFVLTVDEHNEYIDDNEDLEQSDVDDLPQDEFDVEILADFNSNGQQFSVVRAIEPVLLIAKEIDDGVSYKVLQGSELDDISPIIEEYIERKDVEH